LTAIKRVQNKNGKVFWSVLCDCGNTSEVDANALTRIDGKGAVSCGCMNFRKGKESSNWKSPNEISHAYFFRTQCNAKRRKLEFSITIEETFEIFKNQNRLCRISGMPISLGQNMRTMTASLDRIDSSKGYIKGNVQWLHKDINRLKSNWNQKVFIELCKKVANYERKI